MLNDFLKYSITFPLIIFVMVPATATNCKNNTAEIMTGYTNVIYIHLAAVETEFYNISCCKSRYPMPTLKQCNNSMETETKDNVNDGCCHYSGYSYKCSDNKELGYIGCLLNQQANALKTKSRIKCKLAQVTEYTEAVLSCKNHKEISDCPHHAKTITCRPRICKIKAIFDHLMNCWKAFASASNSVIRVST